MTWFGRKQDTVVEEPWPALEVHPVEFAPKPQDLVEAAHAEWTRPTLMPAPVTESLPWSKDAPTREGLYWWRPIGNQGDIAYLAPVIDFGGRLCIRRSGSGSSTFISANTLARQWAGPVLLADGMRLERLDIEP